MNARSPQTLALAVALCCSAATLAAGCKKQSTSGARPPPTASTDALWKLAPPDLLGGGVVADGTLDRLYGGLTTFLDALDKAPGGAPLAGMIRSRLVTPHGVALTDPKALGQLGIDLSKGAAFFRGKSAQVMVLPVSDPSKLLAKIGGKSEGGIDHLGGDAFCKKLAGRYVCSHTRAGLDQVGKATRSPVADWPKDMRGDIEIAAAADLIKNDLGPFQVTGTRGLRVSARIERGGATVKMHVTGTPTGQMAAAMSSLSPLVKGLADKAPTGLLIVQAGRMWDKVKAKARAETGGMSLPGGVTMAQVVTSLTGDVVGHVLPGSPPRGLLAVGLSETGPVAKLVAACDQLSAAVPPGVTVAKKGDHCAVTVDPHAFGIATVSQPISVELWTEPGALVLGFGNYKAAASGAPAMSPFGRQLLGKPWLVAAWGYGLLAGQSGFDNTRAIGMIRDRIPQGALALWGLYHLTELGIGMRSASDGIHLVVRARTVWSNPAPLAAQLDRRIDEFVGGKSDAFADLDKLVAKNPGSPLARDAKAGGLVVPAAGMGILAAVAIPAFVKYVQRSKSSEARMELARLYQGVRMYSAEKGAVPRPSAGPTPPLGTCCRQGGKCAPDASLWQKQPWTSLQFSMDDPSYYSYQYLVAPDGKSFTVRAMGDLDCDGQYSTFELKGAVGAGGEVGPMPAMNTVNETE